MHQRVKKTGLGLGLRRVRLVQIQVVEVHRLAFEIQHPGRQGAHVVLELTQPQRDALRLLQKAAQLRREDVEYSGLGPLGAGDGLYPGELGRQGVGGLPQRVRQAGNLPLEIIILVFVRRHAGDDDYLPVQVVEGRHRPVQAIQQRPVIPQHRLQPQGVPPLGQIHLQRDAFAVGQGDVPPIQVVGEAQPRRLLIGHRPVQRQAAGDEKVDVGKLLVPEPQRVIPVAGRVEIPFQPLPRLGPAGGQNVHAHLAGIIRTGQRAGAIGGRPQALVGFARRALGLDFDEIRPPVVRPPRPVGRVALRGLRREKGHRVQNIGLGQGAQGQGVLPCLQVQLGRIVRRAVEQLERLLEPVEMLHLPRGVLVALRVLLDGGFPREHPPEREALRPREGDGAVHLQPQFRGPLVALDGVIPEHHPVPTGARHLQAVGQAVLLIRHHQHVPPTLVFRQPGGRAAGVLGESGRLKGEGLPRRLFRDAGQIPAVASGPQRTLRRTGRLRRGRPRSSGSRRRQQQGQSRQQGRGP